MILDILLFILQVFSFIFICEITRPSRWLNNLSGYSRWDYIRYDN